MASVEVGTCEVGKNDVVLVDNKYLDDGRMKLPKTLRDMFVCLSEKSPENVNNITTVGYLIMGLSIEVVVPSITYIQNIQKSIHFLFLMLALRLGIAIALSACYHYFHRSQRELHQRIMDAPTGCSVIRVTKTQCIDFPENISCFSTDFSSLLEVAWVGKQLMQDTVKYLSNKKRKAVALNTGDHHSHLSPSFHSSKN